MSGIQKLFKTLSARFRARSRKRRLSVTVPGRWYLLLTIVMGAVVTASGNNVLYLMESFLLGGLLLSGVLSEQTVSGLDVQWRRRPAIAGARSRDRITLVNRRRGPVFCVEVGEWVDGELRLVAFVPYLPGRGTITVDAEIVYPRRGAHRWQGIAIATKYPFGFARKTRIIETPGERLIWPAPSEMARPGSAGERPDSGRTGESGATASRDGARLFSEGEVRPMLPEDDYRYVAWTASALREEPLVRKRSAEENAEFPVLDLRGDPGEEFERRIAGVASRLYRPGARNRAPEPVDEGGLVVVGGTERERRKVFGARQALDLLAVVEPRAGIPAQEEKA